MAGIFSLLFLGSLLAADTKDSVRRDIDSQGARRAALNKKEDVYYDAYCRPHWTETDELVDINRLGGQYTVTGLKTKTVYKSVPSPYAQVLDKTTKKLNEGIEYCKQNTIKYLPFYFPNMLSIRDNSFNTGVEIETGKKYCCVKNGSFCYLVYLENEPHKLWRDSGGFYEYDAVKDIDGFVSKKGYSAEISTDDNAKQTFYMTKEIEVSEEEYLERTTALEKFPYEFYQLRVRR